MAKQGDRVRKDRSFVIRANAKLKNSIHKYNIKPTTKMKTLPFKLRKNGYDYTQVLRDGRKAMYCQSDETETKHYEVFIIQENKDHEIAGNFIAASESYPSDNAFGITAWTFGNIEKALEKYNSLKQPGIKSEPQA